MRAHRKNSHLTQSDIACLLGTGYTATLSRCEKGRREPFLDMMLLYHLLFGKSIELFFEPHVSSLRGRVLPRLEELIRIGQGLNVTPNVTPRMAFLEGVYARLNQAAV